jgi:hypothetical protein
VTLSLRRTFAAIFAALALACAVNGERVKAEPPTTDSLRRPRAEQSIDTRQTPALALHRAGLLALDPPRRPGSPSRIGLGDAPPHHGVFAARMDGRRAAAVSIRLTLTLALTRRLAAARDGTLSARSTGVPPPLHA